MADRLQIIQALAQMPHADLVALLEEVRGAWCEMNDPEVLWAAYNFNRDFAICPICGTRSEPNTSLSLFRLVVSDAFERGADRVVARLEKADVVVTYEASDWAMVRDRMPRRAWHSLAAGAHYLAHHTLHVSTAMDTAHWNAVEMNSLPIHPDVRDFDELRRISEKTGRPLPESIRLHFSNESLMIVFA